MATTFLELLAGFGVVQNLDLDHDCVHALRPLSSALPLGTVYAPMEQSGQPGRRRCYPGLDAVQELALLSGELLFGEDAAPTQVVELNQPVAYLEEEAPPWRGRPGVGLAVPGLVG